MAWKVDIWPLKSKIAVKFWPSERAILTISRVKKSGFWTFWKLFWSCSEVVYVLFLALKGSVLGLVKLYAPMACFPFFGIFDGIFHIPKFFKILIVYHFFRNIPGIFHIPKISQLTLWQLFFGIWIFLAKNLIYNGKL